MSTTTVMHCLNCNSLASWVRHTQFAGDHPFCDGCARKEKDFGESNDYHDWERLPVVFVFGSNLAGRHGKGAALVAAQLYGAEYGKGTGHHGNSYAIPTKDKKLFVMNLSHIRNHVTRFIEYAKDHPELTFQVTKIGCGHAGFAPSDIAPMFTDAPDNCLFDTAWEQHLPGKAFWGTYEPKPEIRRVMDDEEYE